MTRFAALGDSITVGMGDPAPAGGWRGWAALLAGTLPEPELHNLATLGALAADVERVQLPAAPPCGRTWPASWSASTTRSAATLIPNGPARLSAVRWLRCHALLAAAGLPVGPGPDPEPSSPPPTRLAEVGWTATKGTTWLVRRSRDLVPALVGLALREWLGGSKGRPAPGPDDAERRDIQRAREPEGLKQAFRKPAADKRVTFGSSQGAEPILRS